MAPFRTALPIRSAGRVRGVLELGRHTGPVDTSPAIRRQLSALAEVCALTLDDVGSRTETPAPEEAALNAMLDPAMLLEPVTGPDGTLRDFRIRRTNSGFVDPVGRPPHDLDGQSLLETYPLACAGGLLDRLTEVWVSGEPADGEELRIDFLSREAPSPSVLRLAASRTDHHLLVSWRSPEVDRRETELLHSTQRLARVGGFEENLLTGDIDWNEELFELYGLQPGTVPVPLAALAAHTHPDDEHAVRRLVHRVMRQGQPASAVFRLTRPGGTSRYTRIVAEPVLEAGGRLVAVRGAYQDVSAQHWTEIALAATREQLADSEALAAERHELALRLQQAILPPEPPPIDLVGLEAAVRYRPAAEQERVGGDWYDTVRLADEHALLVVGDTAGHGVEAATGMVVLRNALRGLATTGAGPAQLLGWLNAATGQLAEPTTATAVCARYDPAARELRWARAGHPPPVLIHDGEARPLPLPHGILLGALPETGYEEQALSLTPCDILLLYTDGLIERRDCSVEQALHALLRDTGPPGDDLGGYLDRLLQHSAADTDDDTCLIAIRVR